MPAPQPKPKYILKGPRPETVRYKLYSRNEDGLSYEEKEEVIPCYTLFIPHGPKGEYNSIRITQERWEKVVGYDINGIGLNEYRQVPNSVPLIDPETGETVGTFEHKVAQDFGPDPVLTKAKKAVE